jgi:hypothetical protein
MTTQTNFTNKNENTSVAIENAMDYLLNMIGEKSECSMTREEMRMIRICLDNIANAKKIDVLNQINNL